MKIVPNRFATLCAAFGLTTFFNFSAHSAVTVDGTKDADYGTAPISVQVHASTWGGNNTLANCFAVQDGSKLNLFLGGRVWGNAMVIFIDSKSGGLASLSSNTLSSVNDNYQVNNFGAFLTPFAFETGFTADYMLRIYGDGPNAYVTICDLQSGSNVSYAGNAGGTTISNAFIASARASWSEVTGAFADVSTGFEVQLDLVKMGVALANNTSVKIVALIANGGSDYAPNQFLGSLPTADLLGNTIKGLNLQDLGGEQTLSIPITAVADMDGDGIPDIQDTDIDGDGLANVHETNNGNFVSATDTGTNPLDADSDDDGFNDGSEVNGTSALALVTNPLKKNYATLMVAGDFLTPPFSDVPTSANTMTRLSGQEFGYSLDFNFRATTTVNFKFVANSWANNWGGSAGVASNTAGNIAYAPSATGFHTLSFNHDALTYGIVRTVFANYAFYAAAYGLTGDEAADDDNDGINNGAEFTDNTDPTRANDAFGPVITLNDNALVGVALNDTYSDAGATATDNVDPSVTVNSSGTVDTATVGTYTITYSATDVAGNAAVTKTRTVVVYDSTAGFASRFASVAVPGSFIAWAPNGDQGNSMTLVANFKWKFLYDFTSASSIDYKIVGNAAGAAQGWDSPYKWGQGGVFGAGNNASASVTPGRYAFELDEVLNSASLTRVGDLPPSALSYTPSLASGTVGTPISSLMPTVTGTVTSYSVSPTLPLGLTLNTSSGVISGTPSAAASSADYTVTATNGTGSTTATVTIEVAAAPEGSTFAGAYPGASMTDVAPNGLTYLANYAFGGNETTPATLPVQDTSDPTKLRLVVVFRTDDSTLPLNALGGETTADLADGWSASGVSVENSTDLSPTPANTVRKVISVDRGSDPKKFLRATVTK
jgi:hypothetical protein